MNRPDSAEHLDALPLPEFLKEIDRARYAFKAENTDWLTITGALLRRREEMRAALAGPLRDTVLRAVNACAQERNPKYGLLAYAGQSMASDWLPDLQESFTGETAEDTLHCLNAASSIADTKQARTFFAKHRVRLRKNALANVELDRRKTNDYEDSWANLLATSYQRDFAREEQWLRKLLESSPEEALELIRRVVGHAAFHLRIERAAPLINIYAERYGLNGEELLAAWRVNERVWNIADYVNINLYRITSICDEDASSAQALHDEFGIRNHGRYWKSMLDRQFETRNNKDLSYGIVSYPMTDHNGAFSYSTPWMDINDAHKRTDGTDLAFATRAIESGSVEELTQRMENMRDRYGKKISFWVLGGHASRDAMTLGDPRLERPHLTTELTTKGIREGILDRAMATLQPKDVTIMMEACSTGLPDGIAHAISSRYGVRVLGPDRPTAADKISLSPMMQIQPDYIGASIRYRDGKTLEYHKGKYTRDLY